MNPWLVLDRANTPDGTELTLSRRGEELVIRVGGALLMSSRQHGSEDALATVACHALRGRAHPSLLIGGLGMGFTLRAALDELPADARVMVAELVPAIVQWNRGELGPLAAHPLADARVEVVVEDVRQVIGRHAEAFDAIALDVDNGPMALSAAGNASLYSTRGLEAARRALRPGGVLIVWSAAEDPAFVRRVESTGARVTIERPAVRGGSSGAKHVLFVARW